MMMSSNGNTFCVSGPLWEFPSPRPVVWSFDVFFDLRLSERLSKQSRRMWFETTSCPLWHHCNHGNELLESSWIEPVVDYNAKNQAFVFYIFLYKSMYKFFKILISVLTVPVPILVRYIHWNMKPINHGHLAIICPLFPQFVLIVS